MKHYLLGFLLMPLTSWAHSNRTTQAPWQENSADDYCEVVYPPSNVFPQSTARTIRPLSEPSYSPDKDVVEQVFDNGYEYVYRLAICISPYYFNDFLKGNKEEARKWVKETGEYLNNMYGRDLGVRFELVDDERLFLTEYLESYPEDKFTDSHGTTIINKLIGKENYDCGILIRPASGRVQGRASLGGAYTTLHKGNAMAILSESTVAHELGHMFGAPHTHQDTDAQCIEPGRGQSIMSYGAPRTFFSLASVISVRRHMKNLKYYPNSNRNENEIVGGVPGDNDNIPYVVSSTKTKPVLNRKLIRKNYTVTKGTRFQFNIPVENAQASFTYGAQNYDQSFAGFRTNELQPIYALSEHPYTMFQPYYNEGNNQQGKKDGVLVDFSDSYKTGRYQYLLAAADGARYDLEKVYLNIVEGKKFQINSHISMDQYQGKALNLTWEPCTELYGKDSKVRILLSDDFGQTYKYVLDDQVPNNGSWSGYWPFIKIGRVNYRNFSQTIRGGVIKIEVIGEAAYAVSHEQPADANPTIKYHGGFLLGDESTYVRFKDGPTPYLRLKKDDAIPPMPKLEAYHKSLSNLKTTVEGTEVRNGNVIRRQWKATLNSTSSTYTQLIIIEDNSGEARLEVTNKADEIMLVAKDLYQHKGELGYPLPTLSVMQEFESAYTQVFDANGKVLDDATVEKVAELRNVIHKVSQIKDNEIVKLSDRHYYKLRNFQDLFGKHEYFYLAPKTDPNKNNGFTEDAAAATTWRCTDKNSKFSFVNMQGEMMELEQMISPGYRETLTLDRGYTWGAFTLVDEQGLCGQLSQGAKRFSRSDIYAQDPVGYRTNRNGTVSTDFQFIPVEFIEARKPDAERPWNILENKQQFTLEDNYSDLFVGKPVSIEKLQYKRQFNNTEWQTLYLPFDTDYSDWAGSCEIACINEVLLADNHATATYVKLQEGKLSANQPYLIRAKTTGEHHFTFNNVTVRATEENRAQLAANGFDIRMNGNYGQVSAENLKNNSGYTLQGNMLVKANGMNGSLPSMRWYLSVVAENSSNTLPQSIRLLEKGEAPIGTLSIETKEGYGTIYTDQSYVMPEGVTGYIVTEADVETKRLELIQAFGGGETVPAGTPLLVKGDKRTYMLYAPEDGTSENELPAENNLLLGTTTESITTAPNGQSAETFCFYKMYYGDTDNSGIKRLGFYWGAQDGAAFTNQANKAYLAVSKNIADRIRGFALPGDNITGIIPIESVDKEPMVYTITGIRLYPKSLSDLKPGVYIINGQKKIIR